MFQTDPLRLQFVLFHNKLLTSDSLNIAQSIRKHLSEIFYEAPTILPAQGAPPDFPRLIFKSGIGHELVITQEKTFFLINKTSDVKTLSEMLVDFAKSCSLLTESTNESYDCRINRLGFVVSSLLVFQAPGIGFLLKKYLKEGFPTDILRSEVHWLTRPTFNSEEINRWVRLKSLTPNNDSDEKSNSIELIVDINTIPKENIIYNVDLTNKFINYCVSSINDNLDEILLL